MQASASMAGASMISALPNTRPNAPALITSKLQPSWHSDVYNIELSLHYPENLTPHVNVYSQYIQVSDSSTRFRVSAKQTGERPTAGIYINPVFHPLKFHPLKFHLFKLHLSSHSFGPDAVAAQDWEMTAKLAYSIRFISTERGSDPIVLSHARDFSSHESWGFGRVFTTKEIKERSERFYNRQLLAGQGVMRSSAREPLLPFKLNIQMTVRFFDVQTWGKYSEAITKDPCRFLYLKNQKSAVVEIQPNRPDALPDVKARLRAMLEDAQSDVGVVTFVVGEESARIMANSCIIQSRIGVPLLHGAMMEGATKEIRLPHISPNVFRIYLRFLYTNEINDSELAEHAITLMDLANQHHVKDLMYACECYLCWATQVAFIVTSDGQTDRRTTGLPDRRRLILQKSQTDRPP